MIALDYLVAVYPLLLLIFFYGLVTAYEKGQLSFLCKPFLSHTKTLRRKWYIKRTIKDAFITFLLLSYIKLLITSLQILDSTVIYDEYGRRLGRFLTIDARIKLIGPQHLPFVIVATSTTIMCQ